MTLYKTPCIYIHFENELFPNMAVLQKQQVDVVWYCTFLSGQISTFVFDILQIPSGRIAPTCTPLATVPHSTPDIVTR
jgi:hypothetical protein